MKRKEKKRKKREKRLEEKIGNDKRQREDGRLEVSCLSPTPLTTERSFDGLVAEDFFRSVRYPWPAIRGVTSDYPRKER